MGPFGRDPARETSLSTLRGKGGEQNLHVQHAQNAAADTASPPGRRDRPIFLPVYCVASPPLPLRVIAPVMTEAVMRKY